MSKFNYYLKIESSSQNIPNNQNSTNNQNTSSKQNSTSNSQNSTNANNFVVDTFARETSPANPINTGSSGVFDPKNILDTKKIVGYISKNLILKTRI